MKLTKYSVLAVLVAATFVLVAPTFAAVITEIIPGGATSVTGTAEAEAIGRIITNNNGFSDNLDMFILAGARVNEGRAGTAHAEFTLDAPVSRTVTSGTGSYKLSTTIDGAVTADAEKLQTRGMVDAYGLIEAESGVVNTSAGDLTFGVDEVNGSAIVGSHIRATGTAIATATAEGLAQYRTVGQTDVLPGSEYNLEVFGKAEGITALDAVNTFGGSVTGAWYDAVRDIWVEARYAHADITAEGFALDDDDVTFAAVSENLSLAAQRGISFNGESSIEGIVIGDEQAESLYFSDEGGVIGAAESIADVEAVSEETGFARAFNRNDIAFVQVNETAAAFAEAEVGSELSNSTNDAYVATLAERKSGPSTTTVEAQGYLPFAEWTASGLTADDDAQPFHVAQTGVNGMTGFTDDGLIAPLEGFGAASMLNRGRTGHAQAVIRVNETAGFVTDFANPGTFINEKFSLLLEAPVASLTTSSLDAAGAYGGVLDQNLFVTGPALDGQVPVVEAEFSMALMDQNAINWLEGTNVNTFPGHFFFSQLTLDDFTIEPPGAGILRIIGPTINSQTLTSTRHSDLTYVAEII
jgi:hypothetical protein